MNNYEFSSVNEIYDAKAEDRKKQTFTEKLRAVIKMQEMEYSIARSQGRESLKPWHPKSES